MRYKIRQKIFSFGDNFTIQDEHGQDQYIIRGKIFTLGNKLRMEDLYGNELFYIEQKLFRFLPEYYIFSQGEQIATVKKEFTFFKPSFHIESSIGTYEMHGDIFNYDFELLKNGDMIAHVSKKFFAFSDTYGVDILDTEDQAFILSLVIVIDQVLHDHNRNNS